MTAGLRGNVDKLSQLSTAIRSMPARVAVSIVAKAAPAITDRARASFDAGQTAYGDARAQGADGGPVKLKKSGAFFSTLRFVATGTRIRAALGVPYAKYLMRFGVLPRGGAALPREWSQDLTKIASTEISRVLGALE